MKKKQFKLVFVSDNNTYELWFTDHTQEWVQSHIYNTFTLDGDVIESKYDGSTMINENVLWEMNKLINLGYEFIGIERS